MHSNHTFNPPKVYILNHKGVKSRMTPRDHNLMEVISASTKKCDLPKGLIISKMYGGHVDFRLQSERWQHMSMYTAGDKWYIGTGFVPSTTHFRWMIDTADSLLPYAQRLFAK